MINGGVPTGPLQDDVSATIPYDGIDQWHLIAGGSLVAATPVPHRRTEIVLDHCLADFSTAGTGCNHYGVNYSVGALIMGEMKLVKGPNGGEVSDIASRSLL